MCFSATLFVRLRRSVAQEASLGTNDIAVDSGGHSASLAMVDQDSCIHAEEKGRKRSRGGQSKFFGFSATAIGSAGDGLAPRKPARNFTVQPSVANWMCSSAAASRAPATQLQKLGTLASRGILSAGLVRRPPPRVSCRGALGGSVSCMHDLLSSCSPSHVCADARFSLSARVRTTAHRGTRRRPRTSSPALCLLSCCPWGQCVGHARITEELLSLACVRRRAVFPACQSASNPCTPRDAPQTSYVVPRR